eukprot:COSAG06_NODE_4037_length_4638_cov_4.665124_4_plen_149_part_01
MLVEGGGEAVVVQAGLERLHPLGRTIRMFWRLTQRRPAPGTASKGASFRRKKFDANFLVWLMPLLLAGLRGDAAIGSRGCGGRRIEAQQLPIESGLGAARCVAHIRERAGLHRGATRRERAGLHRGATRRERAGLHRGATRRERAGLHR